MLRVQGLISLTGSMDLPIDVGMAKEVLGLTMFMPYKVPAQDAQRLVIAAHSRSSTKDVVITDVQEESINDHGVL